MIRHGRKWVSARGPGRLAAVILTLGLALGLAAPPTLAQVAWAGLGRPSSPDALLRNFERMAFGEDGPALEWSTLERWGQPVAAILVGDGGEPYRADIETVFAIFEAMTGLEFTLPQADSAADIEIFFSERAWFRSATANRFPQSGRVLCFANTLTDFSGTVISAVAVIPNDLRETRVDECIAHELMHTLGFPGHPSRTLNSALRNGNASRNLTVNDMILIRTLYDPRLRPGMLRGEVLLLAKEIIGEMLGRVRTAADPVAALAQRRPIDWWKIDPPGDLLGLPEARF